MIAVMIFFLLQG